MFIVFKNNKNDFQGLILATIITMFIILRNNMWWTYNLSYMRNIMLTTFSQQILNGKLLLVVIDGQKVNFSNKFIVKLITIDLLGKCCEYVVDIVALLIIYSFASTYYGQICNKKIM